MTMRTDITVDFTLDPRIIEVAAPSTELTLQDLHDTLRNIEDEVSTMDDLHLANSVGKDPLGGGQFTSIVLTLNNARIKFEARAGPDFVICKVSGGTLLGQDENEIAIDPIEPSDYTTITYVQAHEGVIGLKLVEQILKNRLETDPSTGTLIIYDDDDTTILLQADIYEDVTASQKYRGKGLERRNKLK